MIEQYLLIERHVGDADGALVPQCAVVAKDRDLVDGIAVLVEAAVAIVVADRIGRR